jgi:hypothetical protein
MATRIIPIGTVFGKWIVISEADGTHRNRRVSVRCTCGHERTVNAYSLLRGQSGGCHQCAVKKHGQSHTPTWNSWQSMNDRCAYFKKDLNKRYYGDRGITVCERWRGRDGFVHFLADMGERPPGLTLDRIDNNGNYEPNNCRWITMHEQARNKRNTVRMQTPWGVMPMADAAAKVGLTRQLVWWRLKTGCSDYEALGLSATVGERY